MLKSINEKYCIGVSIISCLIELGSVTNESDTMSHSSVRLNPDKFTFLLRTAEVQEKNLL